EVFRLETDDLEQKLAVLGAIVVGLDYLRSGARDDMRLRHQSFAAKPCRRLVMPLAPDQVEDAAALIGRVVEPSSIREVDRQRAAVAVAPLVSVLLVRLAEQPQRDRLHQSVKVDFLCKH